MTITLKRLWTILFAASLLLASCRAGQLTSTPTTQPDLVLTAAEQTAEARLTEIALPATTQAAAPSDTPVPSLQATDIPTIQETFPFTLPVTLTALPTETQPAGTAPVSSGGDRADYVSETIADGTNFGPGEAFVKTWTLKNTGTTTWTPGYALTFLSGAQMGGPEAVALTKTVAPGETADIDVNLVSPQASGNYRGYWIMRNAAGELFDIAVWVDINVVGGTPGAEPTNVAGGGSGKVTGVSLRVDDASASECPHAFDFTATIKLKKAATVTYVLEAGTDVAGFAFDLPGTQTVSLEAGSHTLTYSLNITDPVEGWVQLHVLTPDDLLSNQVNISLTCK
jgi:hypothetical protein